MSREVLRQRWHVNTTARKPPVAVVEGLGESLVQFRGLGKIFGGLN